MDKLVKEVFQRLLSDTSYRRYHSSIKAFLIDHDPDMFVGIPNEEITDKEWKVLNEHPNLWYTTKDYVNVAMTLYMKHKEGVLQ